MNVNCSAYLDPILFAAPFLLSVDRPVPSFSKILNAHIASLFQVFDMQMNEREIQLWEDMERNPPDRAGEDDKRVAGINTPVR
jgi:hypothetical protein